MEGRRKETRNDRDEACERARHSEETGQEEEEEEA